MNVVAITGTLTGDPARRETPKGVVTTFRIGSDGAPRVWIDVECWGHLAGTCAAHLDRGRHVAVSGALGHATWTDREGARRERWFVKAAQVTFLDQPRGGAADQNAAAAQTA
jgi:single-strand DNA-binding protein